MTFAARPFCIGALAALLTGTAVQAQEACTAHVVVAGDNLRTIARNAYGNADLFRMIYNANVEVIGKKADLILIGTTLVIPCDAEGTLPVAVSVDTTAEVVTEAVVEVREEVILLNPDSLTLSTEVIDPAKQPVELLPELPFVIVGEPLVQAEPTAEVVAEPVPEPFVETVVETAPEAVVEPQAPLVAEAAAPEDIVVEPPAVEEAVAEAAKPVVVAPETVPETVPAIVEEAPAEVAIAAVEPPVVEPVVAKPAVAPLVAAPSGVADSQPVRFVTGNDYAPFADEMLPGGGMMTQLVEMAIFRADPSIPYNLTFVNDWQAHIDSLLPSQAYDLSFPWVRPNCEADMLGAGDLARCEQFVFSAPFYEIVDGLFVTIDSQLVSATAYSAFQGSRICRPEGYTTGVLDAAGLTVPGIELLRPTSAIDCFEALASGKVDVVSIDAEVGDSAIAELGLIGKFAQNPHLTNILSLHVIAHKSNARAVAMVQQLDAGIAEMYQSGEWYDIVSSALASGTLLQ